MTEEQIIALAAELYRVVRHEDAPTKNKVFAGAFGAITLTPFDGAYIEVNGQTVWAYDHDPSWETIVNRIRLAL